MLPTAISSMQYIGSLHHDIVAPGSSDRIFNKFSEKLLRISEKKIVGVFNRTIIRMIWPEISSLCCMVDTDAKKVLAVRHHAHSLFFDKVFSCLPATACKNGNDCQGYGRQAKTTSVITATMSLLYDVSCRDMQTKIGMSVLQTTVICSQSNVMYGLHAVRTTR